MRKRRDGQRGKLPPEWQRYAGKKRKKKYETLHVIGTGLTLGTMIGIAILTLPESSITFPWLNSAPSAASENTTVQRKFSFCHTGGGTNCVVDGDTVWIEGTKIRIADIDAPETHPARCAYEADLGEKATRRLHALLNSGPVTVAPLPDRDADKYGRKLRILELDGQSIGGTLITEGLARPWEGRRMPWCI